MFARSTAWRHGDGRTCTKNDVDQQHVAVADEQVGRLDVAVGEAGVPQPADDAASALVDDAVVDRRVADLLARRRRTR